MARELEGTGEDGVPGEDGDDVLILGGGGSEVDWGPYLGYGEGSGV